MKNNKEIPEENLKCAISGRAVPLGFNTPSNRYPIPVACCSCCTTIQGWFYEYHGMYWYSITVDSRCTFNSTPFFSMQTAISEFRAFLQSYGFRFVDTGLSESYLCKIRSSAKPPKTWKV